MSKNELMQNATRTLGRLGLKLRKHSPEILLGVGLVGTVATTVMACKATTKLNSVLEGSKKDIDAIHKCVDLGYVPVEENEENCPAYSQEDGKKDLTIVYTQTAMKVVKLYGPAVITGALSLGSILVAHKIMKSRNLALAAAYAATNTAFKDYRSRVVERFGEQLDRELRHNLKVKEIVETVTNEDGEEETVVTKVTVAENPNGYSEFAIIFDDYCTGYTKSAQLNKEFLIKQQNYLNDKLRAQGYLFYNDLRKALGLPITPAGQEVGWIYDEKKRRGDGYVDFRMFDVHNEKARDFVNGRERCFIIDPNVDGYILDLI